MVDHPLGMAGALARPRSTMQIEKSRRWISGLDPGLEQGGGVGAFEISSALLTAKYLVPHIRTGYRRRSETILKTLRFMFYTRLVDLVPVRQLASRLGPGETSRR